VVVDWSESALVACEYAAELARPHGAGVTILVATKATTGIRPASDVDALANAMRGVGVEVDVRMDRGEPSGAVISYARSHGCDCVVVGLPAHDADAAAHALVQQMVGQAVCPVMTVKSPKFPPGYRPAIRGGRERTGSDRSETAAGGMPCMLRTGR
jgi:nucleotide-binding universal stress UspA family protein